MELSEGAAISGKDGEGEWCEYDSDDETEVTRAIAISLFGECAAPGCGRPRARNRRSGGTHTYCSQRCSQLDNDSKYDKIMTTPQILTNYLQCIG